MSDDFIYLDYAASTPVDPRVTRLMLECHESGFANPSSNHVAGRKSRAMIDNAAAQLAALLNVDPETLIWTSGATESDNLAIAGAARHRAHRGKHLVTLMTEHKAVTDVFGMLEKEGFEVTWLTPDESGHLDPAVFAAALRADTQLASIMYVNNETGVMQDIASLGGICREHGVLFHVDAAQAVGKIAIDLQALPVDLLSLTGHKFYGPKGIGALYVADRPDCHIEPILFGGGQQRQIRPGTLPADLIAGLGLAADIAASCLEADFAHLAALRRTLWRGIRDVEGVLINGDIDAGFPGILNVSVANVEGESLLLELEPLCVATGSACNSTNQEPSYVLRALGRSDLLAQSAIRFSLGRPTSESEVEFAARRYRDGVARLRDLAPEAAA
ncbi:MAG: aminotransferase class V-fold PLP-dependent enzyme [Gammaproteobacteria bacterium]|nr:aminotransferase class V-fold PLP-dependent enzyme [Gammaproteobacteria bacterium]MBU2678116.1 aminotransferase class V-fold PLP-dependent enzyme [Gammaproteobacteria bacterium]NNC56164.1 aminotransferase class V-fold PLP-dependent enzyme [Woeseiaceae bacterium]NNL51851.1 aminotransferase class V-fold PLP-dependent enzyme [Woeseiaceae bacterium]